MPFYVAIPASTYDRATPSGSDIPIEERDPDEVTRLLGFRAAPAGTPVYNPAFDVTPHELITAFVTDSGVFGPLYLCGQSGGFERQTVRCACYKRRSVYSARTESGKRA